MNPNDDLQTKVQILLDETEAFLEEAELDEEIHDEFLVLIDQVRANPSKGNLEVLSKLLSSLSKASLAETALNLAELQ